MFAAMLMDLTKCIACRGCQVACKAYHDLPATATKGRGTYENPTKLSADTWTRITFTELEAEEGPVWTFAKRNCMHCQEPACQAACMVGALHKTDDGPVIYDASRCIGCRYCMLACPFRAPRFQWLEPVPYIRKCDMCADLVATGGQPACASACPTGAILFGDRDELIDLAGERMKTNPGHYVDHIYGQYEVGGTSMLYLSSVPFAELGFPELGEEPISRYSEAAMATVPGTLAGVAAAMGGIYWIIRRREKLKDEERESAPHGGDRDREANHED